MTNNYRFRDISLNNLITDINSSVENNFVGITTGIGTNVIDLRTMENAAALMYLEHSTDVSTRTRARNIIYSTAGDITVDSNVLTIPGTSTRFTHFTAYIAGGSGGGGGAGGDAETNGGSNILANTSIGGVGGSAGYAALISNIPLNGTNLTIRVGAAGNGGSRGADDNNPGRNGSPGNQGNSGGESYINLGTTRIATANGGGGGVGGGGANSGGGNGNTGAAGNTGTSTIASGYTGNTTYNANNNPSIDLTGGAGGTNTGGPNAPWGTGFNGRTGYVRIYLKYIPP